MNAAQVRSKARMAMRRREEEIEAEEIEGGELNLIPYLDIVTNLMLFLLASISAGIILGQLNTTLPDAAEAKDPSAQPGDPNEKPLGLVVFVTPSELRLLSTTGIEGPEGGHVLQRTHPDSVTEGEYAKLNELLHGIASRRWAGAIRELPTYDIMLMAEPTIPYGDIIKVMDAMRCKLPEGDAPIEACLFPEESMAEGDEMVSELQRIYDPKRKPYDPDTDALFNRIAFAARQR
jgi:biopolymer transport protein TolR